MTLDDILRYNPCKPARKQWLAMYGDLPTDTEISLGDVVRACGAQAAWWCLRACDPEVRRRAVEVVLRRAVERAQKAAGAAAGRAQVMWASSASSASSAWSASWSAAAAAYRRELDQQVSDLIEAFPPILEVRR